MKKKSPEDGKVICNTDGDLCRSMRDEPPTHYTFKITQLSLFSKISNEGCPSQKFQVGGYNWQLVLYPNGKGKGEGRHLSFYLRIENTFLPLGWEVQAVFRLFAFDQIRGQYLMLEETQGKRFHAMKTIWGSDEFIPLSVFKNQSYGYLVNDTCVLGAEVFIIGESRTGKIECLRLSKGARYYKRIVRFFSKGCHEEPILQPAYGVPVGKSATYDATFSSSKIEVPIQSLRDDMPTHYTFKITSFSHLSKLHKKRCDSKVFPACGYKWKMSLSLNKNKQQKAHYLSLYLGIEETGSLQLGWEIEAVFRLFVFDQIQGQYLMLQENNAKFHAPNTEWRVDEFMSLRTFSDPSCGFLVKDSCIFGASVFICRERCSGKGECLEMITEGVTTEYTWKIENFSQIKGSCVCEPFGSGYHKWRLFFYPGGYGRVLGNYISLYLKSANSSPRPSGEGIFVRLSLTVIDQSNGNGNVNVKYAFRFPGQGLMGGLPKLMPLSVFTDPSKGFLVNDTCIISAKITILGAVENFQNF
ncbi:probable inactive serine/threonine-protein kinase fnkC isoform X2 [Macadamia integrifolia]|uniref:probable inactive serine/threonine-protein kinase fnkC isoform X2 n=1 Tax=Macadamia integrifolia TaxID=60698 RepID=UPI001C501A03|nr:probable inactive serine/threonine-protein kinase fnkC isoform X2 [Macadamia integrifolia]